MPVVKHFAGMGGVASLIYLKLSSPTVDAKGQPLSVIQKTMPIFQVGTLICCGALWTPRCHIPCHVTVL